MKFLSFFKKKQNKLGNEPIKFDNILGNAILMHAFYEKGKVKKTSFSQTISSLTGSDVIYG